MTEKADEPVADATMDAKMREIWAKFDRPWIRNTLRSSLPPTPVTSMNCDFIVHPKDNYTEFVIWEKGVPPEHEATQAIADRLAGQNAVIVDVGANAGAFCLPILKAAGREARAVVFEPNPVMQQRLDVNIALNGFENVEVFRCAVGDAQAQSKLFFPKNGNLGQGRINVEYGKGSEADGVIVDIRPLSECLSEAGIDRVDFLKVDVEGLEDRVICPLLQTEGAPMPKLIYFEVAHEGVWQYPLTELLEDTGYVEIAHYGGNSLFELRGESA